MTASVNSYGMIGANYSPGEREEMYLNALFFYANELLIFPDYRIIFAENSGWDLQYIKRNLPASALDKIEFISLDPSQFNVNMGKSFNEVQLIHHAIHESMFLKETPAFLKVTGRYPIFNIRYFIDESSSILLNNSKDLYVDLKSHSLFEKLNLPWASKMADVRIFGCSNTLFEDYLFPDVNLLNDEDGYYFEGLMYNFAISQRSNPQVVLRFKKEPHFGGFEGSKINSFVFSEKQNSFKGMLKRHFGNITRRFIPSLWI